MATRDIKIGIQLPPQYGELKQMRAAWIEAEALGADRIYVADHFKVRVRGKPVIQDAVPAPENDERIFEATTIQAAIAATTTRAEIGCLVHGNSYRNPNLMADVARTIDHISGGRYILGIGSGYRQPDYDEYGYPFGTAKSRMEDFVKAIPIIKARLGKLNPPPMRQMPLLMAAMGEHIGMPLCARHANIWHVYGELEKVRHKCAVFNKLCTDAGRNPADIEISTNYFPGSADNGDPDAFLALGITHIIVTTSGPSWDLGILRELLQWKDHLVR